MVYIIKKPNQNTFLLSPKFSFSFGTFPQLLPYGARGKDVIKSKSDITHALCQSSKYQNQSLQEHKLV